MSRCVEKLPHSCGSSDALQVFSNGKGKFDGYCFACSTYVDNPYPNGSTPRQVVPKDESEIEASVDSIDDYSVCHLPDRRLNASTLEHFGVRVGLSRTDGVTPELVHFPYFSAGKLSGYKVRLLPQKKFWAVGSIQDTDLFGWAQAQASGASRLYITEGEFDALTVWQVISKRQRGTPYENNTPAVVSLPHGSGSAARSLSALAVQLRQFREVILVFDQDKAGSDAVQQARKSYPAAKAISYPGKDPNDALVSGFEKALGSALLFKAETPKNTKVVSLDSLVQKALEPVPLGLSWPFPSLTEITRGLRFGETYYFGSGVKMGKSDLANTFVAHFSVVHDLPVYIANMEETNVKSTKKILGKVCGHVFHDPTREFDPADLVAAAKQVQGKIHFVDAYQHITWEYLQQDIHNVVANLGVKLVLIDPITNLTNGIGAGETDAVLRGVAQDLAAMARDLDIAIFIFCHLKSPDGNASHERGAKVLTHQFTGSRAMARSCNYMVGLEGNKDPILPIEERNTRKLVVLEDREFGETGIIPLYWNHENQQFIEMEQS